MANIFYSVGTNSGDRKNAATITIVSGVATFSAAQPDSVGIGDKVTYNTTSIAYISARQSATVYNVITATGGTPGNVSGQTVNSITRVWNNLQAAIAGFTGASYINTVNLVTGTFLVTLCCYADGTDTPATQAIVTGLTTSSSYYLKIYVPYLPTEVGITQRHNGKWGTGYTLARTADRENILQFNSQYCVADGISFLNNYASAAPYQRHAMGINTGGANSIVKNCLFRCSVNATSEWGGAVGGIDTGGLAAAAIAYNCIAFDYTRANSAAFSSFTAGGWFYNCTAYNCALAFGISGEGNCGVKNGLASSCTAAWGASFFAVGTDYNFTTTNNVQAVSPGGGEPANNIRSATAGYAAPRFRDTANYDFRLQSWNGTETKGPWRTGVDLSATFTTDVESRTRVVPWERGASMRGKNLWIDRGTTDKIVVGGITQAVRVSS
jgi:hypothetical protein